MRADLDLWAASAHTQTAWSGTEQVSATGKRNSTAKPLLKRCAEQSDGEKLGRLCAPGARI